ncbi:MAG: hypothetical protein RLZZ196_188 [Bacteroidota bacterium]|jgi:hypothetical protein
MSDSMSGATPNNNLPAGSAEPSKASIQTSGVPQNPSGSLNPSAGIKFPTIERGSSSGHKIKDHVKSTQTK